MTYIIADHHGCNFAPVGAAEFPVFDQNGEYCGQIYRQSAWTVPDLVYEDLRLPKHLPLYLTSEGQWAATLEHAEHYLAHTEPPTEFRIKGASLSLFLPNEWLAANSPNIYADYRVYQSTPGFWDAEKIGEGC